MIRLANNYSYRFLKDDTKVFAICKNNNIPNVVLGDQNNKFRNTFYSEPYISSDAKVIRNAVVAFTSYDLCVPWMNNLTFQKEQVDVTVAEFDLSYIKDVTDMLHMPLIVILDDQDDKYEIFYYIKRTKDMDIRGFYGDV